MEIDEDKKTYELQQYDYITSHSVSQHVPHHQDHVPPKNVQIHEKSPGGAGRIQFAIQLIQLILLVILLIAAVVILSNQYTNDSSDCSPAPVVGSNDKVLTDLANTSTDTQSAVKEVSQIILAEIERRLNDTATLNRLAETTNVSSQLLNRLINGTSASAAKLMNIVNTLSKLEGTGTSTAGVADDILLIVEELLELHNETAALPTSCKQILEQQPNSPSGYYILAGTSGTYSTYCNMDTLCNGTGGWIRLAYLDMTDAAQSCPSGFRLYQSGSVRACGRPGSSASCASVQFPSNGISYSQVCGRVTGYQYGSTDAVGDYNNNISSHYVDGVSITRGSPRQHVWTLMAGLTEAFAGSQACPCNTGNTVTVVPFIGNNYFCESGISGNSWNVTLYTSDPLWDGQGCGSSEVPCCSVTGIPWFHRDYGNTTTTDYIELRVCGDQGPYGEDNPVSFYEIYIR